MTRTRWRLHAQVIPLALFFGWLLWQLAPLVLGDLRNVVGTLCGASPW